MMVLLYLTGALTGGCCTDANVKYFMNVMDLCFGFPDFAVSRTGSQEHCPLWIQEPCPHHCKSFETL